MSKLGELIEKLCPDGVVYKTLKSIAKVNRGKRLTKSQLSDEEKYEVYHGSKDVPLGKYKEYNVNGDTVIIVNTGGIGGVKYLEQDFWCSDGSFYVETNNELNNRFLYHYLSQYEKYFYSQKRVGGVPTIDKKIVEDMCIPVPPLEVQCEIVHILDDFTLLSAELSAELKARKKQYEFYRDELLKFDSDIPTKKIIEVAKVARGKRVTKKDLAHNEKYPVFQNSFAPMGYYKDFNYKSNKTYVISAGAAGEIGFCTVDFWAADDCLVIYDTENVLNKFIYYYLMLKQDYIRSNVRKASIPRLSRNIIENLEIPILSIEQQQQIINILDRFDKLCNDISEGLPAEIEARQKQYEYYRDKLLNFKELKQAN